MGDVLHAPNGIGKTLRVNSGTCNVCVTLRSGQFSWTARSAHNHDWIQTDRVLLPYGIRQSVTKRGLFGAKRKTLCGVADYLHRNRARMRYDEYLAKGWPIASGPVEGACKNLIKDRMERSGMRWTEEMAEAIVQLRAIYLSGDFDRYWSFHIARDQQRLHPGNWSVVLK